MMNTQQYRSKTCSLASCAFIIITFLPSTGCAGSSESSGSPAPPETQPKVETSAPNNSISETDDLFGRLLAAIVTDNGLVRYDRLIGKDLVWRLPKIVEHYASATLPESPKEKLAMLCNAYNANVLMQVITAIQSSVLDPNVPLSNMKVLDVPGFFDQKLIRVAGLSVTLNDLENKHIRTLGDARVHAALVCGAMSCPPLRNEPFTAAKLDEQLDDQCRRWVNDASKNTIRGDKLALSKIFDWYGEDFEGKPFGGPAGFVRQYSAKGSTLARFLTRQPTPEIEWMNYDWSLNQSPKQVESK